MTAPRPVFFSAGRDAVAQSIADAAALAVRAAVPAVGIVDQVRAYLHGLELADRDCCVRGGCVACRERQQIVTQLRGLLGDETWRCAWCQTPVSSLPCTNPACPGRR